jgi:hypothetical protein
MFYTGKLFFLNIEKGRTNVVILERHQTKPYHYMGLCVSSDGSWMREGCWGGSETVNVGQKI